jgi:lipoprotein-anchoring transpeptidase ErfK/SrfK
VYQQALDMEKLEAPAEAECAARLTALANQLILNPRTPCAAPKAVFQKVEAGDTVEKIARKNKVNIGQIKVINRLNDKLVIRFGQVLKMLPGNVVYKVNRTTLTGTLTIDGVFIRRFPVGIGPGNATPIGEFTVETKLVNPDWWYEGKHVPFGDPSNILGTRWMGFAVSEKIPQGAGIGVHGTSVPESVPGRESKGCVRMLNKDVEELYDLMPQGGTVLIVD